MISVIVPVYKTEKYLKRCVDSILSQDMSDLEIILVDDGSPDESPQICDDYATQDSRVKVIHKKNEGLGMARNTGVSIANGDYVAFIDSDDFISKDYFYKLYQKAEEYNADACVSGSIFIDNDTHSVAKCCISPELHNRFFDDRDEIKKLTAKVVSPNELGRDFCSMSSCFSLFKRSLFIDNQLSFISERSFLSEDMEFNMRLYQVCGRVYLSDIAGYHYWYNENSLSRGNKNYRYKLLMSTCDSIEKQLNDYGIYGENYRVASYFWVNFEKCINQELRYNDRSFKEIKYNILKMIEEPNAQKYIKMIYRNKKMNSLHHILCSLLVHKKIKLTIILLKVYNLIKH